RARVSGLLVPPNDDDAPLPGLEVIAAGHPLPTAGSFRAARRALDLAATAGPDDVVLFLVSGGGSALLELPLAADVSVAEWRRFQQALVGSGASIERVNAVRMRLSAVKGGRLGAAAARARAVVTLCVSDVPGRPETIASGPTAPCGWLGETLLRDLDELRLWDALPPALRDRARRGALAPVPAADDVPGDVAVVADESCSRDLAAAALDRAGVHVDASLDLDDRPYEQAGATALARLDALAVARPDRPVALVTTGELSVPLPEHVGVGGRNLHFALHCATELRGAPVTVLSCGTDGVDGNSPAAGAVVDGETAARARAAGVDLVDHLRRFDAYPALGPLGCAVEPGPTGVNVRDLRVLLRRPRG
ncbi:MAG: DUF4147 domain-containing protein, partial [Planctomycetota bacterium]